MYSSTLIKYSALSAPALGINVFSCAHVQMWGAYRDRHREESLGGPFRIAALILIGPLPGLPHKHGIGTGSLPFSGYHIRILVHTCIYVPAGVFGCDVIARDIDNDNHTTIQWLTACNRAETSYLFYSINSPFRLIV